MSKNLLYDKHGQGLSIAQWKKRAEDSDLRASGLAAKNEDYRTKLVSSEREVHHLRCDLREAKKKIKKLEAAFEAAEMDDEYGEGTAWSEAQDGFNAAEDEIRRLQEVTEKMKWLLDKATGPTHQHATDMEPDCPACKWQRKLDELEKLV